MSDNADCRGFSAAENAGTDTAEKYSAASGTVSGEGKRKREKT